MAFRKSPAKLDGNALWDFALRLLAQRPYSAGELRQKLRLRAADPGSVTTTIDKLREYGMADDQKFSEAFATARLKNQGFGQQRVLRDLRSKQVAGKTAEDAVAKVFTGTNEIEMVEQYLARKYRGKDLRTLLQEDRHLQSAYRRLRLAGFRSPACFTVLRRYKNDLPEPADGDETAD